jgi:hypothetical protein
MKRGASEESSSHKNKMVKTSNALFSKEEQNALATLTGVNVASQEILSKHKDVRKNLRERVEELKEKLGQYLIQNQLKCVQFVNKEGNTRFVRFVETSSPKDVNIEKMTDAVQKLSKNDIIDARAKLLKKKEKDKVNKLAPVIEVALEIKLHEVVKHMRTVLDVTHSKERAPKDSPDLPTLPAALVPDACNLEIFKTQLNALKGDKNSEESQVKAMILEKEKEVMPILESFIDRHEQKSHRVDITMPGHPRQEMFLREKIYTPPLKWFSVKSSFPIVCSCVEIIFPPTMDYSEQVVDDFLANAGVKSKLITDLTEKMNAERLNNRKPPVRKVKLEKSKKKTGATISRPTPVKTVHPASSSEEYDSSYETE